MRTSVRLLGFAAIFAAGFGVFFALAPKTVTDTPTLPSATQYESLISTAISDYELNNASAESAPQQQVVNGWVAKDLLTIMAKVQADLLKAQGAVVDVTGNLQTQPFDERIPALLLVAIAAICWSGVSGPRTLTVQTPAQSPEPALAS